MRVPSKEFKRHGLPLFITLCEAYIEPLQHLRGSSFLFYLKAFSHYVMSQGCWLLCVFYICIWILLLLLLLLLSLLLLLLLLLWSLLLLLLCYYYCYYCYYYYCFLSFSFFIYLNLIHATIIWC